MPTFFFRTTAFFIIEVAISESYIFTDFGKHSLKCFDIAHSLEISML